MLGKRSGAPEFARSINVPLISTVRLRPILRTVQRAQLRLIWQARLFVPISGLSPSLQIWLAALSGCARLRWGRKGGNQMATVIYRDQLTPVERKDIEERYAPYHRFEWFWTGFYAYWNDTGRYRCPWSRVSVAGQAWNHGHEAAMRLRWERKMPIRDEYEQDDRDSEKMHRGLRAGIEEMRRKGTLPKRSVSSARTWHPVNDNNDPPLGRM
jgi:hypothetical protein